MAHPKQRTTETMSESASREQLCEILARVQCIGRAGNDVTGRPGRGCIFSHLSPGVSNTCLNR